VDLEDLDLSSLGYCASMHRPGGLADSDGYISGLSSRHALGYTLHPTILNFKEPNFGQAKNIGKHPISCKIDELLLNLV
jgi:hypothetical protein